jgi:ATP-dependent RNA helicase DDX3X
MSWESAEVAASQNGGEDAGGAPAEATINGDTTNGDGVNGETEAKPELSKEELLKKARDKGWTEAKAFDYAEFQRSGGNDADFHGAGKVYEWKDEYGEVGPRVEELEVILFGGEFQMKKGEHADVLDLTANIDGPTNDSVKKVRSLDSVY